MMKRTLSFAFLALTIALPICLSQAANDENTVENPDQEINRLFSDPVLAMSKAVATLPPGLNKDFSRPLKEFGAPRSPASATQRPVVVNSAPSKTRMPASVTDGFEMLIHFGKQVSAFWVVKRASEIGDKLDFVFANNTGSRVTVGLSPESFAYLQSQADSAAQPSIGAPACNQKKIELHVVESGKPERNVASCIDAKTKAAKSLRELSELLASFAR